MREILFRGKPKDKEHFYFFSEIWSKFCNDGFVYGSLIVNNDRYFISTSAQCSTNYCVNNGRVSMIEVIPETVGQYTGLTDKNDKKIFEGDILKVKSYDYEYEYLTKVFHNSHTLCVDVYGQDYDYTSIGFADDIWDDEDCEIEVIGNIHDNPELLERG